MLLKSINKVWRFICIYGVTKTLYKVAGRTRKYYVPWMMKRAKICDIGMLGCGQFAFATIGHVIARKYGRRFFSCFDIKKNNSDSFSKFYQSQIAESATELIGSESVRYVYIASNHASHTDYAIQSIRAGKITYIEKPISVSIEQFGALINAIRISNVDVYAGYNRPFSKAIRDLKKYCYDIKSPLTLNCFISGHMIPSDHWYRTPEEGSRICGNIGHWLDLAVHILSWNGFPDKWEVVIAYSDSEVPDDNLAITLISDRQDLINIIMSSRCEPFEGINETINFQAGNVIAKIDDFRKMSVWRNDEKNTYSYWPKDVGHQLSILQPFIAEKRDWHEVEISTLLMICIKELVIGRQQYSKLSLSKEWERLISDTKEGPHSTKQSMNTDFFPSKMTRAI